MTAAPDGAVTGGGMDLEHEYVVRFRYPWKATIQVSRTTGRARLDELKAQRHPALRTDRNEILSVRRVPLSAYEDLTEQEKEPA